MSARYVVGIDLGTTHSVLAYAEIGVAAKPIVLAISQLTAKSEVFDHELLPSFVYFAHESEGRQPLSWDPERRVVVGEYARRRGADAPARVISSAKSWLSHTGVDRRGGILPLGAPDDIEKISPVEASWKILEHLSEAWDAKVAHGDRALALAEQDIVLTVPASFDASARELTVEAALAAGFEHLTLLEEPQAAVYAFIDAVGEGWRRQIRAGDVLLVVDIGGGTTDFSAIAAVESDGSLELERIAVGDHILLGGDNMDLALAHVVRTKLSQEGKDLDRWQMSALTHGGRAAKEKLLGEGALAAVPIAIGARGSQLLGSTLRTELTREEVERVLVDGFFPRVAADARPVTRARGALTQVGLPYASDPAITKHLAAFLTKQASALEKVRPHQEPAGDTRAPTLLAPTSLLFNGGVMKSQVLRGRLLSTLDDWVTAQGRSAVRVLDGADLDFGVARGAAAYGLARRGKGLRIRGGTARAYYVGIENPMPAVPGVDPPVTALCVAPFGMEEGTEARLLPHELGVVVGEPVRFRFFGSSVRRDDEAGTELESWKEGELDELSPIEVTLPPEGRRDGDVVPVRLRATVTAVGTLEVEAIPTRPSTPDERWRVELSVRSPDG
ncbi:MAG TPA: Hsp70 family protein [Polyangiaceae bacterium]|nr:Hsp70 family protein [Polyangiaceae bacterium]